jgi:hypothetical protein
VEEGRMLVCSAMDASRNGRIRMSMNVDGVGKRPYLVVGTGSR